MFRTNLLSPIWFRLLNRPQRTWTQSKINPSWAFGFVVTDILDIGLQPNSIWGTWIRHDTGVVEKYRCAILKIATFDYHRLSAGGEATCR